MFPIAICKVFEEFKHNAFEERFECFKLINTWLHKSPDNFPLIICQGVASMAKSDELFKKGCIEFLRNIAIKKPYFCSIVGGFRLLITNLLDENFLDISDNIIFTLLYIMNTPSKRKYFNGFEDFYKIFAIFTKSDFTLKDKDKPDEGSNEERNKLDVQLELSKRIIEKLLKTWPGYSLIMGDSMAMGSIIESLNTDTSLSIKKNVLDMVKDIIENDYIIIDNFTTLSSNSKDEFYINKIYLAYILQGLQNNNLYESLIKFIEKDNSPLIEYANKIALKFTILYSKLSNSDLQLPFLNEKITKQKQSEITNNNKAIQNENNSILQGMNNNNNNNITNQNHFLSIQNNTTQQQTKKEVLENELISTKVKIMNLLDQTFYHFNCKDFVNIEISDLSTEIVYALNSIVNTQNIKKYNNQYSIESSKKELYNIDNESFQLILKNSKILDYKEFKSWDWKYIDEILDIIETRKDLIMDLYRQKFFKRLLYCFMPSKNQFVKLPWTTDQFIYASIGTKLFKLLAQSQEGITILDTSPEEYLFQKSLTWYEDLYQCLENLIKNNDNKEQPFTIKRLYRTMSKHIFNFLGVLSHTAQGETYLETKGFYKLISKFISNSNYDYILINLIDNLNFNSKNFISFIIEILNSGSNKIKRYVFEHMKCLLIFGKDIMCNVKLLINSLSKGNNEVNYVIISILKSLIQEGKHIDELSLNDKKSNIVSTLSSINKEIIYLMMRNKEMMPYLDEFIKEELKNLNMKQIVNDYAVKLEENMNEIFNYEDTRNDSHYLNIYLPKIENQYENYTELFWLKQLPFCVNVTVSETHKNEQYLLTTYLEYFNEKKLIIYATPQDTKQIHIKTNENQLKFYCMLGEHYIDTKCKVINYTYSLTFDKNEYDKYKEVKVNNNLYHRIEKEGVSILLQPLSEGNNTSRQYILYAVYFSIRIRPEKKQFLKTPINILTEFANSESGIQTLINLNVIDFLFSYLDNNTSISSKEIKSALWILAKIIMKETTGDILENKYQIINKITTFNKNCEDYAMKGTICYIMCYISQNKNLKHHIEKTYDFFFNTDICIPKNLNDIYINSRHCYENKKLKEDSEKISKQITLTDKSNEIFSNVTSLINNISYKQAYEKLNEMVKTDAKAFNDPNLFIKIYAMLSRYKCRQNLRRFIMILFENAIASPEIYEIVVKKMEDIGQDLFEFVEENEDKTIKIEKNIN